MATEKDIAESRKLVKLNLVTAIQALTCVQSEFCGALQPGKDLAKVSMLISEIAQMAKRWGATDTEILDGVDENRVKPSTPDGKVASGGAAMELDPRYAKLVESTQEWFGDDVKALTVELLHAFVWAVSRDGTMQGMLHDLITDEMENYTKEATETGR